MPGSSGTRVGRLGDALRALVDAEIAADAVAGAVVVVEPGLPQGDARQRVELAAGGARGKRAVASAMWPFSTRVKRSRISAVGGPIATVRVMSVVPSRYWAPESTR